MNIAAFIRPSKNSAVSNLRFRITTEKGQLFYATKMPVPTEGWTNKKQCIKPRYLMPESEKKAIETFVVETKKDLLTIVSKNPDITRDQIPTELDKLRHPENYGLTEKGFFDLFGEFIEVSKISEDRKRHYRVLMRSLQRYELYNRCDDASFFLNIHELTSDDIEDFENYLRNEHELHKERPHIFTEVQGKRKHINSVPKPRGDNTISTIMKKYRRFFRWLAEKELTSNDPFPKYKRTQESYGTPYYLTMEELKSIYATNMNERLTAQRDIFILQCMIGCRVSDLYRIGKNNIINGKVQYIPQKTKEGNPITVSVPLTSTAIAILEKYAYSLPLIAMQNYNYAIKDVLTAAGVTRNVITLNSLTGKEEQRPINEVASSHMARRTFVGNLYKKVQDPSIVGSLSGHKEGSRAFARYRAIDDDIKKDVMTHLEL